jgi:hypothetical protein
VFRARRREIVTASASTGVDVATRTVNLRRIPIPLWDAVVDMALAEDRDPLVQAERLLREGLERGGYWPPAISQNDEAAQSYEDRAALGAP